MAKEKDNFYQIVQKKAFEISYAIFRVAYGVKVQSFSDRLQKLALDIMEYSLLFPESEKVVKSLEAANYFLRLGVDLNMIHPASGDLVISEIAAFNAAIAGFSNAAILPDLSEEIKFSEMPIKSFNDSIDKHETQAVNGESNDYYQFASDIEDNGKNLAKTAMRQAAILERIRQNGNCRLKEIQEFLPYLSERTIRYDIQTLIEQGFIERVGNGGPSTYYKIKDSGVEEKALLVPESGNPDSGSNL